MHILDRIDQWARRAPARIAHQSGDRTLTYAELAERSDALALVLQSKLGENRAPIAVHGHKEPEMLVAFLAAVKSGRPYVPIDISIPAQRVERIIANAGAALVLTPAEVAELAGSAPDETAKAQLRRVGEEDPFYILFTSGSTGEPK